MDLLKTTLLIVLLCVLATSKVTLQGLFAKSSVKTFTDGVLFNGLIFAAASLLLLPYAGHITPRVLLFGAVIGVQSLLFQITYIRAMSAGNVSVAVMIVNTATVITTVFSIIAYREPFGFPRPLGLALMIGTIFLCTYPGRGKAAATGNFRQTVIYSLAAMLISGGGNIVQKIFAKTASPEELQSYSFTVYLVAALSSAVFYAVLYATGHRKTFAFSGKCFGIAAAAGVALGIHYALNTYAVSVIDGAVFYPSYSSGVLILSALSGVILLHDKLRGTQKIGIVVGVLAIVLLSFPV